MGEIRGGTITTAWLKNCREEELGDRLAEDHDPKAAWVAGRKKLDGTGWGIRDPETLEKNYKVAAAAQMTILSRYTHVISGIMNCVHLGRCT